MLLTEADLEGELLIEFPGERLGGGLPRLDLAAGKLPEAGQRVGSATPRGGNPLRDGQGVDDDRPDDGSALSGDGGNATRGGGAQTPAAMLATRVR